MTMKRVAIALAMTTLLQGCATIVKDKSDTVTVFTPGCPAGTKCKISNKRGSWIIQTPNTVSVPKSDDKLVIECSTPDGREMEGYLKSEGGNMIWGNIIFGGIIGAIVDSNTDAHREYDDSITIPLCK